MRAFRLDGARRLVAALAGAALMLASCGGGGGGDAGVNPPAPTPTTPATPTGFFTAPAQEALTVAEVGRVLAQAVGEARARNLPSTIAVSDRVGNILAVFEMTGADTTLRVPASPSGVNHDLQGVSLPAGSARAGAIAKAVTAAYLSSGGNAFSTRTASELVQEHFPPARSTAGLESGPLYGVQFSQLPCSDLSARFSAAGGAGAFIGPKRSPLGLAADAGGLPLYKNGVLVGGIGVMGDGVYGFDPNIQDMDDDAEEYVALAGTQGFAAPDAITANRITVDGTSLRFSDATAANLRSQPAGAPSFASLNGSAGSLVAVAGYAAAAVIAGTAYGSEASGLRPAGAADIANPDAYVLSDGAGNNRFPIRAGSDAGAVATPLTQAEVTSILQNAFTIMRRARAQIRMPLDSRAQVSISVVDTLGAPLGTIRSPDAPIFGTDVSLQKARTAAFFSGARAGPDLDADPSADVRAFVAAHRLFFGDERGLDGRFAITDRANGNISRPYFPDGEVGTVNGPFSRPIGEFNPFSTGLQSALVLTNLLQHVGFVLSGGAQPDTRARCTLLPDAAAGRNRLQNGIQIFPGSVPVYRGGTLVGGIGVSGDGIDQDDMISFLGLHNAGLQVGGINNAPADIRSDRIVVKGVRLRFVSCPFAPFLDTSDQNVCDGK